MQLVNVFIQDTDNKPGLNALTHKFCNLYYATYAIMPELLSGSCE